MLYRGIEYRHNLSELYEMICFNGEDLLFVPKKSNTNYILGVSRVGLLNSFGAKSKEGLYDIFELNTETINYSHESVLDCNSLQTLNTISIMVRDIQRNIIAETSLFDYELLNSIKSAINDKTEIKAPSDFSICCQVILSLTQESNSQYGVYINEKRYFVSKNFKAMKFLFDTLKKTLEQIVYMVGL